MQKTDVEISGAIPKFTGVALRILAGSVLYAASTVLLIFPQSLLLGGTSGISVILESFLPFSPGKILMGINFALIGLAFAVLGKNMAARTLAGSVLTTVCIGAFDAGFPQMQPLRKPFVPVEDKRFFRPVQQFDKSIRKPALSPVTIDYNCFHTTHSPFYKVFPP